jgi:hypothetical protein
VIQVKVNQREEIDVMTKVQLNTDMVAEYFEDSEKVKHLLDNTIIIGALKGYQVSQVTEDYTFWLNHKVFFKQEGHGFYLQFSIKRYSSVGSNAKKIDSLEISSVNVELKGTLSNYVGEKIKQLTHSNGTFFTYHQKSKLKMLEVLYNFIVNE